MSATVPSAVTSPGEPLPAHLTPSQALMLEQADFSLVLGGPLFQLFRRSHLSGDAFELLHRRIVVLTLVAWLPLLVLSGMAGTVWGNHVAVPFFADIEVHVRFLVALPLLILAELVVHRRMRLVVRQFLDRGVIPDEARERFDEAIASVYRLRNSTRAELLLLALVYGVGVGIVWRLYAVHGTAAWHSLPAVAGWNVSPAGIWFTFVSLPIFQFLLLRWYFRICLWARFLWQVSRLPLSLMPAHPDRVGGLGFLSGSAHAFMPLAVAHGAVLAGLIGRRVLYHGAALTDFKAEIAGIVVLVLGLVFGPLLVMAPQLARAKRDGVREFGTLAERYVREFDAKWLRGGAPRDEAFVGSADIQSLADLGNSYEVVRSMRPILATRDAVIQLGLATLLPLAPLLLTIMPLEDILKKLLGILF